jgi:hypothetical protein
MTITPADMIDRCRRLYNSVGDTFWSDTELYEHMHRACIELAREAFAIERKFSASTVDGQQGYSFPTNSLDTKRVTINGKRLERITFREDDQITLFDEDTSQEGEPSEYYVWDSTIYLRPVPDAVYTLVVYAHAAPQEISVSSSFEIPQIWVPYVSDFVIARMAAKEKNYDAVAYHEREWNATLAKAKLWARKQKTRDRFNSVHDETANVHPFVEV